MTMGQALGKALAAERGGAAFYDMLAQKAETAEVRTLFARLAADEQAHIEALERHLDRLPPADRAGELPEPALRTLESVPGWEEVEAISTEQAFEIALQAEINASLYYSTLGDFTAGDVKVFFDGLAEMEDGHAEALRQQRDRLAGRATGE